MEARADEIAAEPDKGRRDGLVTDAIVRFKKYENGEGMSLLELAVLKTRMASRDSSGDREQDFQQCGAENGLQDVDSFSLVHILAL